jgi:Zn-dependent protease with chaperone function
MEFEPQVLESIHYFRRRAILERVAVLVVFALAAAGCIVLLVLLLTKGRGLPFLFILAAALAAGALYTALACTSFNHFTRPVRVRETVTLEALRDELEAVSIGAGITAPTLVVLDLPTMNTVAFRRRGKYSVGVTGDLVEAPVYAPEAEALMAHEVAHILTGDVLAPRHLWRFEVLPFVGLAMLGVLGAGVIILLDNSADWMAAVVLPYLIFLIWSGIILGFVLRRLDRARRHDDLMADSIAVKMTLDPFALQRAIQDMDEAYDRAAREPADNYCSRHLFICPHDFKRHLDEEASTGTIQISDADMVGIDEKGHLDSERANIGKRLRNLEAIEQGHWPAFGDEYGGDVSDSSEG